MGNSRKENAVKKKMWNDNPKQWKIVFEEAWKAFCCGSIPIGAALFDNNGDLIISDRNRSCEAGTVNREISHAEANVLRRLDTDRYNSRETVLYTSMEPCPMCMGMILMGHISEVHYAAADSYCGMVHLTETDAYYKGKHMKCVREGGEKELFQLTIQSYNELRFIDNGASDAVVRLFAETNPMAVETAKKLYEDKMLDRLVKEGASCSDVYDQIMRSARIG